MFIGHIAAGVAAKKITSKLSLWILIPVAMIPDIIAIPSIIFPNDNFDPVPWSHGLFMCLILSLLVGLLTLVFLRNVRTSFLLGSLVLSHWLLDFVSWPMKGRGLPLLFTGSTEIGLGLYNTTVGSILGETFGFIALVYLVILIKKSLHPNKNLIDE
jgi:hypothetical protein